MTFRHDVTLTPRHTAAWLALLWTVFIVYGSLVPLSYVPLAWDQAWARFQHIPFLRLGLQSRADWVANGVLYLPLGLLLMRAFKPWESPRVAALSATAVCWVLAVGVEFTQLWFPQRTVSLNDILAECLGSLLGVVLAQVISPWVDRLAQGWRSGGERLLPRLLEGYAAVYVLLCFFPYDFVLTAGELQGKMNGNGWGWLFAPSGRGAFLVGLQWLVEVALALPLGALPLVHPAGRPAAFGRAALLGMGLGLLIEGGQLLVNSGVSQGASVLSRVAGLLLGALLWPWLRRVGWAGLRSTLRPYAAALACLYLPVLAIASGVVSGHAWHGVDAAWASWQSTHWLPFYYHYFTSEALALFSLGSVALMYAPVLALAWLRGWGLMATVALTAVLALLVEAAKLWVNGLHADPTNVIVAVAANAALGLLLGLVQQPARAADKDQPKRLPVVASAVPGRVARWLWLLPVVAYIATFPVLPATLLALMALAAAAVWLRPVLALGLIPAALPILDLAPWSGRYFVDEFDAWQAVCLVVAWNRLPPTALPLRAYGHRLGWAWALLGLSLLLSSLRAVSAADPWTVLFGDNAWNTYHSPWNALRIAKGALWAWAWVALWKRLPQPAEQRARVFGRGMLVGLALTVLCVLWERMTFTSMLDFVAEFRVTGPFSAMHTGGAAIECYLAIAASFAIARVLQPGPTWRQTTAGLMLAGTAYAMLVTYARNGYAALVVVVLVSVAAAVARGWREASTRQQWAWGVVALAGLTALALSIADSPYARRRLLQSLPDLAVWKSHWADGLALRDDSLLTLCLGMGLGRYPERHYWRSTETVRAASFSLQRDHGQPVLRLGQGATLYIEQVIERPAWSALKFSMDFRASGGATTPGLALCEKWTLTSLSCAVAGPTTLRPEPDGWQHLELPLDASLLLARPAPWRAPLKLSLLTPQRGAVDVRQLRLSTGGAENLLANGDFAQGLDRWYFATDVDPPWQLHSLPLTVFFEQGWLGVLVWAAVLAQTLPGAVRSLWRNQAVVPEALPALLGFVVSGLLNTLIDAPRLLWLLLVLLWLSTLQQPLKARGRLPIAASPAP